MSIKPSVIVYDAECAFCRKAIRMIRERDRDNEFAYMPRQTNGIEDRFPELKDGDFNAGMRLFDCEGKMYIGADAIYRITLKLPSFRWFSWIYCIPVFKGVIRSAYSRIAANRLKLSRYCGKDDCLINIDEAPVSASVPALRYRIAVSALIFGILGLHGLANFAKAVVPSSMVGDQFWPFLAYGMYRNSRQPGTIRTTKHQLFAVTNSGRELRVVPQLIGMHGAALNRHYLRPMVGGNPSAPRRLANRINIDREDPVVAFRIDSETYAIAETGIILENSQSVTYSAAP